MKKLYIVDFSYFNLNGEDEMMDRWFLACINREEVEEIMKTNFKELNHYGYEPIRYSYREITKTDNGCEILIR